MADEYADDFEQEGAESGAEDAAEAERRRMMEKVKSTARSLIASEKDGGGDGAPAGGLQPSRPTKSKGDTLAALRQAVALEEQEEAATPAEPETNSPEPQRPPKREPEPEPEPEPERRTPEIRAGEDDSDDAYEEEPSRSSTNGHDESLASKSEAGTPVPADSKKPKETYVKRAPPSRSLDARVRGLWRNARMDVEDAERDEDRRSRRDEEEHFSWLDGEERALEQLRRLCFHGKADELAQGLIRHTRVNLLEKDAHGWTLLHFAASRGKVECADVLLYAALTQEASGGGSESNDSMGLGDDDEMAVSRRTLLNAKDSLSGWTPLHVALIEGHEEMVRLLLDEGAELGIELGIETDAAGDKPQDLLLGLKDKKTRKRLSLLLKGFDPEPIVEEKDKGSAYGSSPPRSEASYSTRSTRSNASRRRQKRPTPRSGRRYR